jgi:hypothetical protein
MSAVFHYFLVSKADNESVRFIMDLLPWMLVYTYSPIWSYSVADVLFTLQAENFLNKTHLTQGSPCLCLLLPLWSYGYFYLQYGALLCEHTQAGKPYWFLWCRSVLFAFKSLQAQIFLEADMNLSPQTNKQTQGSFQTCKHKQIYGCGLWFIKVSMTVPSDHP